MIPAVSALLAQLSRWPAAAGLIVVAAVFAIACSDSGDSGPPPSPTNKLSVSSEGQAYLDQVLEIDTLIGAIVVRVESALEGSYATRGRLFSLIDDEDVYDTFQSMVDRLDSVDVPSRYAADHERYLESLNESLALAEQLQPAIDARNLVTFDITIVGIFVSRGRLLVDASPSFCAGALRSEATPGCESLPPGSQYGIELRDAFRRFRADFGPRVTAFPPAMNADEIFEELNILQPPIIEALETAAEEIREMDPPSEFADDHAIIEQYFEDTLDVSRAISQAAEERDAAAQQIEFARSGQVLCEAALALSEETKAITEFFDDSLC